MFHFRKSYFLAAVLIFFIEVFIAVYVRDGIIRPYGGDVLVVIFLYFLLRSFFKISSTKAILGVLAFAFFIEGLQHFQLVNVLGLREKKIASVVLGSHFEWLDILAYCLGAIILLIFEKNEFNFFTRSETTS